MSDDEIYLPSKASQVEVKVSRSKSPRLDAPKVLDSRLSSLKKQRSTFKCRLTLFSKHLSKIQQDSDQKSLQKVEFDLRIQSIVKLFQDFNEVQSEIEQLVDESDLDSQLEHREAFEIQYFSLMATAKGLLSEFPQLDSLPHHNEGIGRPVSIKLPQIKLPAFDGSYDKWLEFRNSYLTMIHNRNDLNAIQKFHYLKSSLTDTAAQVISALEFTAPNYAHAWDLLENRFHNNRLLVQNHVKSLFTVQALQTESPMHIRKLVDSTLRNLRALQSLDEPTDSWDTLIVYLLVSKLDAVTEREWESHKGTLVSKRCEVGIDNKIKLDDLLVFLRNRADMLEMVHSSSTSTKSVTQKQSEYNNKVTSNKKQNKSNPHSQTQAFISANQSNDKTKQPRSCCYCSEDHFLYSCAKFLNMSVLDRQNLVTDKKLCSNCLRSDKHSVNDCSYGGCKLCSAKHNTLLHVNRETISTVAHSSLSLRPHDSQKSADALKERAEHNVLACQSAMQPVLLSTALVEVPDSNNRYHTIRVLLDNGSQNCFVTQSLINRLQIPIIQSTVRISGVGETVSQSTHACKLNIRSKTSDFIREIQCLILPSITTKLPSVELDCASIGIPSYISLADPTFSVPSEIDILLGADIFWDLLLENRIKLKAGPYLYDSKLGWIISGPIHNIQSYFINNVYCHHAHVDSQLRKFWELEELTNLPSTLTKDDRFCENLFTETTERDESGRFSVRIPLKESADVLGDSFTMAKKRFLSLEKRLESSSQYKQLYCDFMREYEQLGHMSPVSGNVIDPDKPYYILPHHGVYRETSLTTKLRVVFDASAKTTTNKSFNDIQHIGPPLQNSIFSILLRFRQHKYVACADVEKMYRQILVQTDLRNLQMILWRERKDLPLQLYSLNTVTYGNSSSPYLSIRCLNQLAQECDDELVAQIIKTDFYVDDVIISHNNADTLLDLCNRTNKVLQKGCFPLHKWTFNHEVCPQSSKDLNIGETHLSKTLGLGWSPEIDELHFTTKLEQTNSPLTKRIMLSVISQIYDPLGLLSPAVIVAKCLLQSLWLQKLDWDAEVPENITSVWRGFISSLQCLQEIRIPRYITSVDGSYTELHVFTDASQTAYGACAYVRTCRDDCAHTPPISVKLLCAKSKLAPIKTVSIPRLELCGALLGSKLFVNIKESLRISFDKVYFWTDSTIVQGWLRMSPHLLKTFVQNRVVQINESTDDTIWRHVKGTDNPADLITRGTKLDSLKYDTSNPWWCGPRFLGEPSINWSNNHDVPISDDLPERKSTTINLMCTQQSPLFNCERFSSFIRMQRACAYLLRFIDNARSSSLHAHCTNKTGSLSATELDRSLITLTRTVQQESFSLEYHRLVNNLPFKENGKHGNQIAGLNIFLDESGLIRVGGRLCNSTEFSYDKKHPVLLSGKHRFSRLLCEYEHRKLLHAGPQLLVCSMREQWWVLGARNLARQIVHNCVICTRMRAKTFTPKMGNLPHQRLEGGSFSFMRCGCDFAGPVSILNRKGRGAVLIKAYICLFVCFTTRAIHLELVGSLSTQDYLLALKRFIARRGKPLEIFSDNGKNLVGALKEINQIFQNSNEISDYLGNNQIRLTFIPPYSPHFGGLWEAGIKSCKYHLKRVLGNARLTHEEFGTVLTQIEAVLNSRPLSPLSSDVHDFLPLTPAHFLIGRPLTAPACEDLTSIAPSRLTRYHMVERLRQHFWQRWSKEYVSELQQRSKWKADSKDIEKDILVLVKEDNVPPLKWRMGRITRLFPGADGVSRVAEIRTASGVIRRAFSKICPLLPEPSEQ